MRRGEVWDVAVDDDGHSQKFLVVSSADWNEGAAPQCVPVLRGRGAPEVIPYIVLTNEADPVSGAVEMGGLGPLDPAAFVELSGMLTGATMSKVSDCLRTLYEL